MNKQKPTNNSKIKKIDTPIKIAIIGGIVTLASALITSIVAPLVLEHVNQAPIPTYSPHPAAELVEQQLITESGLQASALTSTSTPETIPTATNEIPVIDIRIDLPRDQCPSVAFPPNIDPSQDPAQAGQIAAKALDSGDVDTWPIVNNHAILEMTVTSLISENHWIKLSNAIEIGVAADQSGFPDYIEALLVSWGCGGGGVMRTFSDILLSADFETYSQESTTSEFDFFTLQPGEFEVFTFPIRCKTPGVYSLSFKVPYTLIDRSDVFMYRYERPILCPKSYTAWGLEEGTFMSSSKDQWDGQDYQNLP